MLNGLGVKRALVVVLSWWLSAFAAAEPGEPMEEAAKPSGDEAVQSSSAPATELAVEDILANPLTDEDYREVRNCVWRRTIDDMEVLDERRVLFRGRRGELWLNQLEPPCLGLDADMLIHLRSYGGSICRLDKFHGRPRFGAMVPLTAECRLGQFETIDELREEALRRAIEEQRRASVEANAATSGRNTADRDDD